MTESRNPTLINLDGDVVFIPQYWNDLYSYEGRELSRENLEGRYRERLYPLEGQALALYNMIRRFESWVEDRFRVDG